MPKDRDKPSFTYRGRSKESVAHRAQQSSGSYDSYLPSEIITFKPHDGENRIRILPWLPGNHPDVDALAEKWKDHWGIDIFVHSRVGPDNSSYLCLDKMKGDPCPVCDARRDSADEEESQQLRATNRILVWLIDRDDEKAGPKIWSMPLGVSKDISKASQVKGSGEALLIDDPEEGYDVYFDKEGEKKKTNYKRVTVDRDPSPLHSKQQTQDRWLEYISDPVLPELLIYFDAEQIGKVLFGQSARGDEDARPRRGRSDGDEAPRGRRRGGEEEEEEARPSRRRGAEANADDDERPPRRRAAAAEEEEAEGELQPRRGSRRRTTAEDEETSQDHDHEAEEAAADRRGARRGREEEPEEEAPRGRRGAREEPAEEEEDPPRRGREERTSSRRRPAEAEPEEEEEPSSAKSRLQRVGARRRGD